ncbi:MAG TPA: redoxin domain-containing protein, partial [Gemmatimonadales bacterium]|nr:redoxin domain-containing protein [Gemmatimonadales bacterium]
EQPMSASFARINLVRALTLLVWTAGVASAADLPTGATHLPAASDRKPAPDFELRDANDARITLSSYKGRVVLLDFWATWCTGCKVEIPWYMEFQKKYARRGLTSIGVAMDEEGWQKVKPYLETHPINYPIVLGYPDLVKPYQIANMPVTLLIDRQGKIADAHIGVVVKDTWEREIRQLLNEKSK